MYNAIVWQDTRTDRICNELGALGGGQERYRAKTGLPLATYFSGPKIRWILDNVDGARAAAEAGDLLFGNMDTWLLWNMTGGPDGGVHVTDPTNASRTLLMDLETLSWDAEHRRGDGHPAVACCRRSAPRRRSTARSASAARSAGVPIAGILGDQQAATFGQACLSPGEAKNTYGTGNFVLLNTGTEQRAQRERPAHHGLLQDRRQRHGLRAGGLHRGHRLAGAVAARQPRHDHHRRPEIEEHARTVEDNGGAYFVPAFSGLFAPVLALRRARRHRRPDPLRQQGPPGPRGAGGHRVPDPRGASTP